MIGQAASVSVKTYGAKGDGVTDDQAAIVKAISALTKAGGGTLVFPSGTYLHSNMLTISGSIVVSGSGASSILKATNAYYSALQFLNSNNCGVQGVKIQGYSTSRLSNNESAGVLLTNSSNCTITNIKVDGGSSAGILLYNSHYVQITSNDVRNTLADGTHAFGGSSQIQMLNNTAYNTGDDSFAAVAYQGDPQTTNVTISNNVTTNSQARGVSCIGAANCVITNNSIVNPDSHGVVIAYEQGWNTYHPSNATVSGNLISNVEVDGANPILVDSASTVAVKNNSVSWSRTILVNNSTGVTLSGLQVQNMVNDGSSILLKGSSGLSLTGNVISNSAGPGILTQSLRNSTFSNNRLNSVATEFGSGDFQIDNSSNLSGTGNIVTQNTPGRPLIGGSRSSRISIQVSAQ
jgi:parallel beta-helix repeat protein